MKEYTETLEQLSLEKQQLAEFLARETGLDFDRAMNIVLVRCDELLPGYRGIDKLFVFRRRIRDRIMDAVRDQREIDEHEENRCTCSPAVRYGVDIPGLGCEVCPHCAKELDKQDIPF